MEIISFIRKIGRSKSSKMYYKRMEDEVDKGAIAKTLEARKGYVAMYVGKEAKRFEVPIKYLSFPTFRELLMQSQDQDDNDTKINGPIMISCNCEIFDQLLKIAAKNFKI